MIKSFARYAPWFTGTACVIYIYAWTQDTQFPAWSPLIWCFGCFVNDIYNYIQHKNEP